MITERNNLTRCEALFKANEESIKQNKNASAIQERTKIYLMKWLAIHYNKKMKDFNYKLK